MADFNARADLFMDGSVTRSLDIRLPDDIVAIMGRNLKIDYLAKRRCILVSRKNDPFFTGKEAECTSNNIIRIPDKIKKNLKLKAGDSVVCSYEIASECLIIKKKVDAKDNLKPQPDKELKKASDIIKTSGRLMSNGQHSISDMLVSPSLYPHQYQPEAFKNYRPSADRKDDLDSKDVLKLCTYVRNVLDADGEAALFLIWRFAFGIDCNTIRSFAKTSKSVNGICEAFRFGCKCFLEREEVVSNASLKRIFRTALSEYEIILLHNRRGIRWMSCEGFENDISIDELARCFQQKTFIELNNMMPPANQIVLNNRDTKRLSKHILNLPIEYSGLLLLRYYRKYETSEIEEQVKLPYVKGKIEYLRRALSDRLGLADKLISDSSLGKACAICVNSLHIL